MPSLAGPAFYVGALGSKRTQEKRRARLLAAGVTEAQLARLRAPIGLDLGGRSPEEIALSVIAEIVAVRNGVGNPGAQAKNGNSS
jgi:xanthine dehydrogenase accessory factor